MIKDLKWPQVVLILGAVAMILGAAIALSVMGKDPGPVWQFAGILLAGLGIGALATGQTAIKEQVNGRMSSMLTMLDGIMHRLADAPPLPPRKEDTTMKEIP